MKAHSDAENPNEDFRDNQPATVARVMRDGLLNSASKEEALMNRDLRQVAASAKLSMLLDQLETALPVLVGAPSLRPADWSELDRRLNGVRSLLANATYRSRTRRARSPTVRPARSDGMPIATLF